MLASDVEDQTQKYGMWVMPYYPSDAVEEYISTVQIENGTDFQITATSADASSAGRLFSMLVLASGILLILVLLPFLFVQFIVRPWMEQLERARAPRSVPEHLRGHLILVGFDAVTQTLIARAKRARTPAVVLVEDPAEASRLHDEGYQAMVGPLDSPATYRKAGVERAVMVVSTQADTTNTNVPRSP